MVAASTKKNSDTFQIYFGNSPTSTPPPLPPLPTPLYQGVNPVGEVESRALTYGFASVGCMLCQ